ncbi:hypothetical protein GMORB2_2635 [Geosmithia morbida]|uniref:Thymidylate kinase n=1 Tax=Geosmithia morbida TaxID=1094350 RepID=A0A9P5CZL3_9HYPO|nr:uncharacterized protein GMORB2_2635 [Geosmithia morbida]KAF4120632.1 hypothetical protein GMORB2_2635 [Geosmithia morbida]
MASVSRQPFAPLDGARLQNLTSIKNRQNAIPNSPAVSKRKAELIDTTGDSENVDPIFIKRPKAAKTSSKFSSKDDILKPSSNYVLKTVVTPKPLLSSSLTSSAGLTATSAPRRTLQPKSPTARLNTASISKSSPLSAPAGRSPPRGKRPGILSSRRRTAGPFSRVDPPSFNTAGGAPFSLDAALKGTIPSYVSRPLQSTKPKPKAASSSSSIKYDSEMMKSNWFFDIHEDTVEQEMTNLLQHSTCVLDISSDEESAKRARREDCEDKENVPPVDDVSQTSARAQARLRQQPQEGDMVVDKERVALGEMKAADFYADGCDETSVIIVPGDEEGNDNNLPQTTNQQETPQTEQELQKNDEPTAAQDYQPSPGPQAPSDEGLEPTAEVMLTEEQSVEQSVSAIMAPSQAGPFPNSSTAAVLVPMEGTGESFELWESSSAKGEQEPVLQLSS